MNYKSILSALIVASVLPSQAASDLANPLNTYLGNSQADFPAQPAFLATSGLDVSFVWTGGAGAWEKIDFFDTTAVLPQVPGAKFGANTGGGPTDGRNYLRTVETDYHTKDFTAFVTVKRSTANSSVFFGLGTGQIGGFGKSPDRGTSNASAFVELQAYVAPGQGQPGGSGFPNASRRVTGNSIDSEAGFGAMTQLTSEALRMRMQYNSTARTITYTFDYDYNGTTFQEDQILPTVSVVNQSTEWFNDGDRASIFFGGDRSVVFTDLVITTATAPAPAPTGLLVNSVGNGTATISWPEGVSGATFSVYRSDTSGGFTTPLVTGLGSDSFTDSGLTNGTPYFYVITQTRPGSLESAFSNEVTVTPVSGVLPPVGVVALNSGSQVVLVDWNAPASGVDTYKIYRSSDGQNFSLLASGVVATNYLDQTGLVNGTTYTYFVRSVLNGTDSADSASAQASPKPLEVFVDFNNGTPTYSGAGGVTAPVGTTWNGIGLGTTANLADSTSTLSSVGLVASGQGTFSKGNGFNVGGDNTTPGSQTLTAPGGYDLMVDYVFQNAGGTTTTYTLTGLVPGRKYDLYLFGYGDQLGQNTLFGANGILKQTSNPFGLTTLNEGRHFVTFTAVAELDGTVPFTWRNGFGADDADASSGSALINGFQLVENASAVLQPFDLLTQGNSSGVNLQWTANGIATGYKIYRSTTRASGYTQLPQGTSVTTSYTDTTGDAGVTYYYVVTAVNGAFESFFSAETSGMKTQLIADADLDGLSDADEALIGTNPNDASDFFVAQSSSVTQSGGNYNVSILINGAPGNYVIERSTTLQQGSWTEVGESTSFTWNSGTVLANPLTLSATGLTPAPGGKEFFRAKGVAPQP